jgi:hypothetical protein
MSDVDKDVAAMLQSLKKYDKLVESCAPVLGMKTLTMNEKKKPDFLDVDKDEDKKEPFTKAVKDMEKKDDKKPDFLKKKDEGKKDDKEDVKEGADPEVLEWMQRFLKLGNMKGYSR